MENNDSKPSDDWLLDSPPRSLLSDDAESRSLISNPTLVRQVILVSVVVTITVAITLLVLNTIIEPVQKESKEIKEMIATLQDLRRSDMGILQMRFDEQEEMLRIMSRKKTKRRTSKPVSDRTSGDDAPSPGKTTQYTLYVVRKNDTLGGIAARHNISVKKILEENEINNRHRLSIGQEIYIPSP
uniref:LysM domain-containing protein n=1 Tax=Candidatus Kentrum sp. MB TaxID=2138164 RepID=A0A450XW45_9GAMM|nr:MAG: LysM domain-containing protein [Candidatus Kentron sp. MB]VFK33521.1 MAG: LysM domain-containing protein [Candidatus Kentron sp. MB]VFK76251.1 MAG: LysM domain-containing protein [Candidatus Kentron sp. MB]